MSTPTSSSTGSAARKSGRPEITRWKKVLLTIAAFSVLAGLGFKGVAHMKGDSSSQDVAPNQGNSLTNPSIGPGQAFLPGMEPGTGQEGTVRSTAEAAPNDWSPFFMKGGASFIIGFCMGYALRAFARISFTVLGLVFLAIFGLAYAGAIDVNWETIQSTVETAFNTIKEQTAGFQSFVTGSLPAAGLGTVGLFTGVKKS